MYIIPNIGKQNMPETINITAEDIQKAHQLLMFAASKGIFTDFSAMKIAVEVNDKFAAFLQANALAYARMQEQPQQSLKDEGEK